MRAVLRGRQQHLIWHERTHRDPGAAMFRELVIATAEPYVVYARPRYPRQP